jgi:hypothetical protein
MFGLFKKKVKREQDEYSLVALHAQAMADIKTTWVEYLRVTPFLPEIRLARKIELFADPIHLFLEGKYPILVVVTPGKTLWMSIFAAVAETKTHSLAAVQEAISELGSKYAQRPST